MVGHATVFEQTDHARRGAEGPEYDERETHNGQRQGEPGTLQHAHDAKSCHGEVNGGT